ncbi:MAG: glycerol kinase, partial [Lachnospiraceae bacterium]|nr:glycerol kinase [Lachnospiraceae bacterium]
MGRYYMGIDQGTTGTTVLVLDEEWNQLSRGYKEHTQIYPRPGWVEHDPLEIWERIKEAVKDAADQADIISMNEIACIG